MGPHRPVVVLFLLAILLLSVLLPYKDSGYTFGIIKLFLSVNKWNTKYKILCLIIKVRLGYNE